MALKRGLATYTEWVPKLVPWARHHGALEPRSNMGSGCSPKSLNIVVPAVPQTLEERDSPGATKCSPEADGGPRPLPCDAFSETYSYYPPAPRTPFPCHLFQLYITRTGLNSARLGNRSWRCPSPAPLVSSLLSGLDLHLVLRMGSLLSKRGHRPTGPVEQSPVHWPDLPGPRSWAGSPCGPSICHQPCLKTLPPRRAGT